MTIVLARAPAQIGPGARIDLMHKALLHAVGVLERFRTAGVAKTNFLECGSGTIYVFEYLFTAPHRIMTAEFQPHRWMRNYFFALRVADRLQEKGYVSAAAMVAELATRFDPRLLTDEEAIQEVRLVQMHDLLRMMRGIIVEVFSRDLEHGFSNPAGVIAEIGPTGEWLPHPAYQPTRSVKSFLEERLLARGLHEAASFLSNREAHQLA